MTGKPTDKRAILAAFRRHKPHLKKLPKVGRLVERNRQRVGRYMDRGAIRPGDRLLDVGCAWGAVLFGLPETVDYVGLDASRASVNIAREIHGRGRFEWLDVAAAKYNPRGTHAAEAVTFPLADGSCDVALACSLFTHFTDAVDVRRYIAEIRRVLKPGGRLLATWFRSPPNKDGGTERRFCWLESRIGEFLAGWTWIDDWGGETKRHDDQWHTLIES